MYLSPVDGWKEFEQGDDVVELISSFLALTVHGGIWDYYNFSETSSLWCSSEINGTNQLQLVFDSNNDNARIKSIVVEFTNNGGLHFKQLFKLKKQLKMQFKIQMN